jgi:D-beta-D-heptose 7-phosphate kinase/D-beta-D-heptose 1-phosphate adenosyltransferase
MNDVLREILLAFPTRRVLVIGDVMLDEYIWGEVTRISPEAPVPIVEVRRRSYLAGGAANTAVNVASLGGQTILGGVVGNDAAGVRLRETLSEQAVDTAGLLVDPKRITTCKTRLLVQGKQVGRFDEEYQANLVPDVETRLLDWAAGQLAGVHACILSDYAKGVVSARFARRFLELARQAGKPVVVDPKKSDIAKFRGATVVKPNWHEAQRFSPTDDGTPPHPRDVGPKLVKTLDGCAVLITCGAEGMTLFRLDQVPLSIPSVARSVFDVTGAGDTVAGTLALALAAGASLEHGAHLANRAAGIVVGKVGTAAVTGDELLADLTSA